MAHDYDNNKTIVVGEAVFEKTGEWARIRWNQTLGAFEFLGDRENQGAVRAERIAFGSLTNSPYLNSTRAKNLIAGEGINGTFTTVDGKTITVLNGIITEIV